MELKVFKIGIFMNFTTLKYYYFLFKWGYLNEAYLQNQKYQLKFEVK